MALTPDEILNHEFTRKGARAYVAKDVDTFLDQVNNDYRALIAKYDQLSASHTHLEARIKQLEGQRDEVNQSIIIAQDAANRLRSETDMEVKKQLTHAQEAATKIISDARDKADAESNRLAKENEDLIAEQNRLRGEVDKFRATFTKLLDQQKELLANQELSAAVSLLPTSELSQSVLDGTAALQHANAAHQADSQAPVQANPAPAEKAPEAVQADQADLPESEADADLPEAESKSESQAPKLHSESDPTVVVFPDNE
ncbi:DivIVA domain-containing protein [Eupransor demetentiae]|uniref:Interacts with FtsZ and MinD (DivIVA) n=1 Tax=Eupransor demetentiae TaxID=3109584 RepID=A0ABM9N4U0_9LACO|nr:Cell division septum initiation protein DivIVA [Lactobacillaceae bacterium LMG 33000]